MQGIFNFPTAKCIHLLCYWGFITLACRSAEGRILNLVLVKCYFTLRKRQSFRNLLVPTSLHLIQFLLWKGILLGSFVHVTCQTHFSVCIYHSLVNLWSLFSFKRWHWRERFLYHCNTFDMHNNDPLLIPLDCSINKTFYVMLPL